MTQYSPPPKIKLRIESFRYRGPHSFWHGKNHWCWRYYLTLNDVRVYSRASFCSWNAARKSAEKNVPRVLEKLLR